MYRAYALAAPRRLPAAFRSSAPWDGTLELCGCARTCRDRGEAAREEIESLLAPPPPGEACDTESKSQAGTFTSTHFHVTYNTVAGGLTVADYAASLERSWSTEVGARLGRAARPRFEPAGRPLPRAHR